MTRDSDDAPRDGSPERSSLADDELLAPFRETEDPVLTTEEVGGSVPYRRRATAAGLDRLANDGVLERKSVDGETVWWLPGHTATESRGGPMPGESRADEGGLPKPLENAISTLSAPSEPERVAVYATCYYIVEEGPATGDELRDGVYPDYPADHGDADEWWTTCVRPSLSALSAVERTESGWRLAEN
ncbi:hypothetical protein M0R88_01545 [Halorussus gelatinilyticus]|uniref:Uncharacterized protein n=1 Tax=Halorussus gelatinilyticus TaxID=2937524 RepID=A0A8U0IJF1_9EURY|nr:hypothetical protein [Halorussus gelatinilyticus]UPW00801.1 hypothetical protein M0R88_01545 [Halorussus gelatinilyticus]